MSTDTLQIVPSPDPLKVAPPARITLTVDQLGKGVITVNGIDVSGIVRAVRFDSCAGNITRVGLEIPAANLTAEIDAALSIYIIRMCR